MTASFHSQTFPPWSNVPYGLSEFSKADSPDWALATWLDSLGAEKVESVSAISVSADLNDSQRERAVRWALQHAAEMGFGLFLAVVPRVLADPAAKASRAAILESSTELTALASGSGERSKLARALVDILPSLAGEDQVMTARWIRELGGQAALESASKTLDDLGLSGLEVLVGEFPESKQLKKRLKSQRRAESAE